MTADPMFAFAAFEWITRDVPFRYGQQVLELGEDGGTLVVLGHHSDRRTIAALNHYARTVWGTASVVGELPSPGDGDLVRRELQRVRAIVVHACHRGWGADERRPAAVLERADPDGHCPDCDRIGADWALLYAEDAQDQPDSFPVTVWEYDL